MEDSSSDKGRGGEERVNNSITLVPASNIFELRAQLAEATSALQKQQTESLAVIAEAMSIFAQTMAALPRVINDAVQTLVKGNGVNGILAGLAQHDGRKSLDARIMDQNALEIVEQLEKVFKKYNTRMRDLGRSDTLVDAEDDFNQWHSDTQPSSQEVSSQEQVSPHPTKQS